MTAEEKDKLYTAIGYSGSSHNLALPKQVHLQIYKLSSYVHCGDTLFKSTAAG